MRSITLSAVFLLAFASTSGAQFSTTRERCAASLERVLAGNSPDWYGHRCDRVVLAGVTQRVRAAAQLSDSARLDRLAGAATSFREPGLFRAALALARDRRATWRARALGLQLARGQAEPNSVVLAREPGPPPPVDCGPDPKGIPVCTVSSGPGECMVIIAKRAAFAVDRPIPARLYRDFWSLVDALVDDARSPAGLRRLARCMRAFTPAVPSEATGETPGGGERRSGDLVPRNPRRDTGSAD
ncbi:MAG: hypothetical protein ACJ8J0_28340 [Longimicrobiaceae bacterium]